LMVVISRSKTQQQCKTWEWVDRMMNWSRRILPFRNSRPIASVIF
jgi:hypothetical protein